MPDGGNYYYYFLVLLQLKLLLLLLQLLMQLLLHRPNECHTEYDCTTCYTVCQNNPPLHLHLVSIQQLLYCSTDDPSIQADTAVPGYTWSVKYETRPR